MHANRRLILIQKWCYTRDFQPTEKVLLKKIFGIKWEEYHRRTKRFILSLI
jgi:hypothetical protein